MKSVYKLVFGLAITAFLISVQPAAAHHSGAGFNSGKIIELKGTVKEFQFKKDRKSTRLNSSHQIISYAVFCLKKKSSQAAQVTSTRMYQSDDWTDDGSIRLQT